MIEKVNKVLSGVKCAMLCDYTMENCYRCPYEKECDNRNLTEIPRNLLMDMGQIAQAYWETLQPGYKTNAEIELSKIIDEYRERLNRYSRKTHIEVGTEIYSVCNACSSKLFDESYAFCPHCGARFM